MKLSHLAFGFLPLALIACNSAAPEGTSSTGSEVTMTSTSTGSGSSCVGWGCAVADVRPTDKDVFDLIRRWQDGIGSGGTSSSGSTPPSGPVVTPPSSGTDEDVDAAEATVRLTAAECVEVQSSCHSTCTIKTTCGGGGAIDEKDSRILSAWLISKGVRQEVTPWARHLVANREIRCKRQGGAVRCILGNP